MEHQGQDVFFVLDTVSSQCCLLGVVGAGKKRSLWQKHV
jgi:hypothetical protein